MNNPDEHSSDRSTDDFCETASTSRSDSLFSLRNPYGATTSACTTSLCLDLKYPSDIDCSNHRLYSRRISAPKFSTSAFKSKLGCFEKQHSHPPLHTHCDERNSFLNELHTFNGATGTTSTSFESSAKAIADNSCFRVYKMTADGKLIVFSPKMSSKDSNQFFFNFFK